MKIVFLESARKDVRNAYDWYEAKQGGLGNKFVQEVIEYSQKLKQMNIEYRKYIADTQYIRLQRFPFSIFFLKETDKQVSIIAGLFNRQDILKILRKRK
ncbi:MAG: hypothetical protein ABL876_13565 [Chitinophagaceae bacterium]